VDDGSRLGGVVRDDVTVPYEAWVVRLSVDELFVEPERSRDVVFDDDVVGVYAL